MMGIQDKIRKGKTIRTDNLKSNLNPNKIDSKKNSKFRLKVSYKRMKQISIEKKLVRK